MLFDHKLFSRYFRMLPVKFEELLSLVEPSLLKNFRSREPISPEERLSVTLRHLATGNSYAAIAMSYSMSPTTVGRIIMEFCQMIWVNLLNNGFLKLPSTQKEWEEVAQLFEFKWGFPNYVGATDGKHVVMHAPAEAGSSFFNYKGTHSIVLMAVVNSEYEFIMVDIGGGGRQRWLSFCKWSYRVCYDNDLLGQPAPRKVSPSLELCFPYVFTGDEAPPMKTYLIRSLSQTMYWYQSACC